MKRATLALILLAGCSFVTAKRANHPATGCSRTSGYADLVVAGASAALAVYSIVGYKRDDCPGNEESGRCRYEIQYRAGQFFGVTIGIVELIQGFYGLSTARACEADRQKLTGGT